MTKKLFLLFLLAPLHAQAACDCGSTDSANPCTGQSISVTVVAGTPNGGTAVDNVYNWGFNSGGGDARCGQFANGDYWVAPASGQTSVTITGISSTSHASLITADDNPVSEATGILSGTVGFANYDPTKNMIPALPQSYTSITSILAAIQRNEAVEGICGTSGIEGKCADSYNVVTVLQSVPENAGHTVIRPNITGESKEILTWSDFDLTRLPALSYIVGSTVDDTTATKRRWSHSTEIFALRTAGTGDYYSEGGRAWRSHILIDDYGSGYAVALNRDIIRLFSDDNTLEDKKSELAAILAFGLDLYHARYDPPVGVTRYWGSGAGQHPGRFIAPALLAGLLVDTTKKQVLSAASSAAYALPYSGPQEIQQQTVGSNGPVYGDYDDSIGGYWNEMLKSQCFAGGVNEFAETCPYITGKRTGRDPYGYIDGVGMLAGGGYTAISLASQKTLVGIMYMMPEICDIVNADSLTTFVNRYVNEGIQAGDDPCVSPDTRENPTVCDAYRDQDCVYYGVTWGPDPNNPGDCIKTATPPYTQVGRFPSRDGVAAVPVAGYTAGQVTDNWATISGAGLPCNRTSSGPRRYAVRAVINE